MSRDAPAIDYDHRAVQEFHSVVGAREALRTIFKGAFPRTVVDFGCGNGSWLKAALGSGAEEVFGVEGANVPSELMHVPDDLVRHADLNQAIDLGRRFDLVLCLEAAEHLEPTSAQTIVDTLVRHGDRILFSAAVPGQAGHGHVNCRWPDYWQKLFNGCGFVCSDAVRWAIWNDRRIEPWYRQNLMMATRDEALAGSEPRIAAVLHPEFVSPKAFLQDDLDRVEQGAFPMGWYVAIPVKALASKLARRLRSRGAIESRSVPVLYGGIDSADARLRGNLHLIEGGNLTIAWYFATPPKALAAKLRRLFRRDRWPRDAGAKSDA